jgi:hypothetical protein
MTCLQAIDAFPDYLARDLAPADLAAFQAHLRGCSWCHEKLRALEIYLAVAGGQSPQESPR